jgi:uncharacterized membrane protein YgcG
VRVVVTYLWDRHYDISNALLAMEDRAGEAVAAATTYAAGRLRTHIVDAIAQKLTLPREEIEKFVHVKYEATEGSPSALLRVDYGREPLLSFQTREDAHGIFALVYRDQGERYIPEGFRGTGLTPGIYRRRPIGNGKLAGRLPIDELHGPSVLSVVKSSPGFLDEQLRWGRRELYGAIMRARDIIVEETVLRFPPTLSASDPRLQPGYEPMTLSDRFDQAFGFGSNPADQNGLSDRVDSALGFGANPADKTTASDRADHFLGFGANPADQEGPSDRFDRALGFGNNPATSTGVSGSIDKLFGFAGGSGSSGGSGISFAIDSFFGFR